MYANKIFVESEQVIKNGVASEVAYEIATYRDELYHSHLRISETLARELLRLLIKQFPKG